MSDKIYITADKLLEDSFELGLNIYRSGYRPNWIVGIWRGGTPVGIAVQELLEYLGIKTDHISIRTSSYTGINEQSEKIKVHGLGYVVKNINSEDSMLIVDDVFDTGRSIEQVMLKINQYCRKNTPDIKVATPYYKPENNKTNLKPDYYLYETDQWIVFPHEIDGLTIDEIIQNKPVLSKLFSNS
jgi:hypoxanthine phosphoribosyltransferase